MLKGLMHNLIGNHGAQGMANIANSGLTSGQLTASMQNSVDRSRRAMGTKKIFDGRIEVQQVANGYTVHIGLKEGYEYTTHIASSITEVNEIIAAAMVAFQLENS